ncbi:MAG: hypothetical protein H7840_02355 [Alphaproteobacteria bacterium]
MKMYLVDSDHARAGQVAAGLQRNGLALDVALYPDDRHLIAALFPEGPSARRSVGLPLLILVDISGLAAGGAEAVLSRIRTDETTRHVPVIILAPADTAAAARRWYDLGCNAFIAKPADSVALEGVVRKLAEFLAMMAIPGSE